MSVLRIAGIQMNCGNSKEKNIEKACRMISTAADRGVDVICLPEMFSEVVPPAELNYKKGEKIPGPSTDRLREMARQFRVTIIAGSIIEQREDKKFNTSILINRRGEMIGKYSKIHLFDAFQFKESETITHGSELTVSEINGMGVGLTICYDLRFPEIYRWLALQGAEVVFVPSAFVSPNMDHWRLCARARALENGIFIIGVNQIGEASGINFLGRSLVVDPWGNIIASASNREMVLFADLDTQVIEETRNQLPLLSQLRFGPPVLKGEPDARNRIDHK
ncbi:MAG: carbon-nitrogen hydrolase family protein [Thermodesulfobacteriota bacterium]